MKTKINFQIEIEKKENIYFKLDERYKCYAFIRSMYTIVEELNGKH